jgi:hypothetical protein
MEITKQKGSSKVEEIKIESEGLVTITSWITSGSIIPVPALRGEIHPGRQKRKSMIRLLLWGRFWVSRQRSSILTEYSDGFLTKEIMEKRIMLSALKARLR